MRNKIWKLIRSNHQEGMILPRWMLCIKAILFPLRFFYWRMSKTEGYQCESDTWLIAGIRYSEPALRALSEAQGETFKITRTGETLTFERVHNEQNKADVKQSDLKSALCTAGMRRMNKLHAILMLPLLPIAILIDLIFGDVVTKVKTPALKKLREHKQSWVDMWNGS